MQATYSYDWAGRRLQLPLEAGDDVRRVLIDLGLRVSFALAQENERSCPQ